VSLVNYLSLRTTLLYSAVPVFPGWWQYLPFP